jgi:hypothetical protein
MISTLVSTVSPATNSGLVSSLALAAVLTLLAFLVMKEMTTLTKHPTLTLFGSRLDVAIVPLLFVFTLVVIDGISHILL